MRSVSLFSLSVGVGLAAGWALGHAGRPKSAAVNPAEMASPSAGPAMTSAAVQASPAEADSSLTAEGPEGTTARAKRIREIATDAGRSATQQAHDLYQAIGALTRADFAWLLANPLELDLLLDQAAWSTPGFDHGYLTAVLEHWLELEPDVSTWGAAVVSLLTHTDTGGAAVDFLAKKQPEKTLGFLASVEGSSLYDRIVLEGLAELRRQNPGKARAWREALSSDSPLRRLADEALRRGAVLENPLVAVDLARAAREAKQTEFGNQAMSFADEADQLLELAARQAAAMGPGTLRQLATQPMEGWMLGRILPRVAELDPVLAVDLVLQSHDRQDPAKMSVALQLADIHSPEQKGDALVVAFRALATRDPAAALERSAAVSGPDKRKVNVIIAQQWAQRDPAAALTWLAQQPLEERMNLHRPLDQVSVPGSPDMLDELLCVWAQADPAAAQAWAAKLPPDSIERMTAHLRLAQQFARQGDARQSLAAATAGGMKIADPETLGEAAGVWAAREPQAAADWATTLPAGPAQSRAVAAVVRSWSASDPARVQAWLAEFPPGEARDLSIAAFLRRPASATQTDAEATAEFERWFGSISDPWQRTLIAGDQFLRLSPRDGAAARAWLQTVPNLDPELKRTYLRYARH